MATKSPDQRPSSLAPAPGRRRLAVTLDADSWAALDRLASSGGIAASQFVAAMIKDARPVIIAVAESFERAKRSPKDALETMRQVADQVLVQGAQASLDLDEQIAKRKLRKRRTP